LFLSENVWRRKKRRSDVQPEGELKMKYLLYCAIVALALIPLHAQRGDAITEHASNVAQGSCENRAFLAGDETNHPTANDLLRGYAANVDQLLRDGADQMRLISEKVEAGDLPPLMAMALKLETARAMIARLETISAVYESAIFADDDGDDDEAVPADSPATAAVRIALRSKRTISVKELLREAQ
jgi:hypothetical protein